MLDPSSIILAVASPPGRSLRGIIRMSGTGSFELFKFCSDASLDHPVRRGMIVTRLMIGEYSLPIVTLLMPGPHSYTGEDSIEIQLPGNPSLLDRAMTALLETAQTHSLPARRAIAGEFTARAFLNGRISLTQAEGVAATIAALSDAELRAGRLLVSGALGEFAHHAADGLAAALALVEAEIDFTDQEDVIAINPADLYARLVNVQQRINDHLNRAVGAERLEAIPWVVLVGEPNAGKSALFNALLGHERAVVSPITGTTRDVLAEPLAIDTDHGPAEVMLIDLAGLDDDDNALNQEMQNAAKRALDRSELILRCVPIDEPVGEHAAHEVLVRTKSDLATGMSAKNVSGILVSANTGEGLDDLRSAIAQRLSNRAVSLAADAVALWPRHEAALRSASSNLHEAIELVAPIRNERALAYPELIASMMRAALDDLAALAGDISPDDVLGRIFATFCVGK